MCVVSEGSDQPAHPNSLIRAIAVNLRAPRNPGLSVEEILIPTFILNWPKCYSTSSPVGEPIKQVFTWNALHRTWSGKKKKWQSGHRSAYVCTESADMKKPWDSPRPAKTQIRFRMLSLFRVMTGSICIGYIFYNVYLKLKCLSFFNVISCLMVCILENNNNILFNNHSASMRRFHFH